MVTFSGKLASFFLLCVLAFFNCKNTKKVESPDGYDFSAGKKIFLLSKLEEISGIAFVPGSDTMLMAVNDEEGKIFPISIHEPKAKAASFKFGKRGDYEDIAWFAGKWRVLESTGVIHSVDMEDSTHDQSDRLLPAGEYEGMASFGDGLYVICKDCPESKQGKIPVYLLKNIDDSLFLENTMQLDASAFIEKKKKNFFPSALARHPVTNDWFILSHLNGTLLIADQHFNVKQKIQLPRSMFIQPEGIAFSSAGDLFISNEGDEAAGYIMIFRYEK
jgi:uncharacterized protein YjiK